MEITKKIPVFFIMGFLIVSNSLFCGRSPSEVHCNTGDLILNVFFPEAMLKEQASCDSLIVEISAPDLDPVRYSFFLVSKLNFSDTLKKIPAGKNREINVYAVDKAGYKILIDNIVSHFVDISVNRNNFVNATLVFNATTGALVFNIDIVDALKKVLATYADSLIVEISASDIDSIRWRTRVTQGTVIKDTVPNIPAGRNRRVNIYTKDRNGIIIHMDSMRNRSVEIIQNTNNIINVTLIPAAGSIYFQIANVHTSVCSLFVSFVSAGRTWEKRVSRSLKLFVSLDNIPHGTTGTVYFIAVNSAGDTIYQASSRAAINALNVSQLNLDFQLNPGNIDMNLILRDPGVSLVSINMTEPDTTIEKGTIFITEILYDSPDSSEYIEIFNPSSSAITIDTLIIDVDNTLRKIDNVSIDPHGFYIFGRKSYSWVNRVFEPRSHLDLSQNGNQIAIREKDSSLIDQVIFAGGSNTLNWPNTGDNRAIVLDSIKYNASMNNFGRNWLVANSIIEATDSLFGSPQRK